MSFTKILLNAGGVALACAGMQHLTSPTGGFVGWGALASGVGSCVLANLIGLFQAPPNVKS